MGDDPGSDSRLTDGKSCVPTARRSIFLGGHVGPNTGICPSGEGTGEHKWVAGGPPSLVTALGDTSRMRASLLGHQATIQNMSVFVLCRSEERLVGKECLSTCRHR